MIISDNAWDDKNALGNSISNWFSGIHRDKISNIYCRSESPCNRVCSRYYRITDTDLVKNFFLKKRIGENIFGIFNDNELKSKKQNNDEKLLKVVKILKTDIFYYCRDILWIFKRWNNLKFKSFIKDNNPDIVFCFGTPSVIYLTLIKEIKKLTNCKIVICVTDNVYGEFSTKSGFYQKIKDIYFRKMIEVSDRIYGSSNELCDVYGSYFNTEMTPLFKGVKSNYQVKRTINSPIVITYAGNLFYGRDETLGYLSRAINAINEYDLKLELNIYTGTYITAEMKSNILENKGSHLYGLVQHDKICSILNKSDIVLHVESFKPENIDYVKYSFSTKIIDCLESGSCYMAIGPSEVASINYSKKVEGSIVVDNLNDVYDVLQTIVNNSNQLTDKSILTYEFVHKYHNLDKIQTKFYMELDATIKEK